MAALTEEQSLIRDQAKSWATSESPVTKFRKMRDEKIANAFWPEQWQSMIEMGWTGILVPEEHGGSDLGYLTFGLILEELGRQLTASPLLASGLIGASALRLGGSADQQGEYLPKIVDGSAVFALAVDEGPRHDPEKISLEAAKDGNGFKLSGRKGFVLEGGAATHLIVAARTGGSAGEQAGLTLFVVPADAAGVSRTQLVTADSRGYAHVDFDAVAVGGDAVLGTVDDGFGLLEGILDRGRAGLGAEMLGTASAAFDMTVEYLKTRKQFGKPIGAFQALGHRAAEMFTSTEHARSCAEAALAAIDAGADDIPAKVSLSKAMVGEHLHRVSRELIQMHGGIGMTDEYDAGFYLKRAQALETIFGNQSYHRERFARLMGY
ncbi:MAG: acyl-CoA dehydrogenase family protein [Pseudomonadales bacterium]|jgi:alkylation response protein AidB-like acyl-CoA dehydrogenase|nr:acyl-CoA dehydrogenase family protein [Pseudomonadales bacterium]